VDSEIESVIDDIYEAAAIPEQWPKLLGRLSGPAQGGSGSQLRGRFHLVHVLLLVGLRGP